MEDKDKTGDELIKELENLRHRVSELEDSEARLKETEQLLREGEERYLVLLENLNEGIFVVKDGVIQFINPRAVEFTGFSADELTSRPFPDFIHPDDREMVIQRNMSRMAGDDTPYEYTVRIVNRDGNINWLLVMSRVIPWHGERAALVGATDITRRKAAEDALRESEQRLRTITETIREVFWMADIETGKTFYVSPGYERVWGRSVASLYGNPRSFLEAVHAEDRKRVVSNLEAKKHGQPFELEYRIVRPDGEIRCIWDHGFPVLDEMGEVTRYVGVAQDITDRKKAEDERRESERKYKDLIEGAPVGIFQSTFDGKVLGVNPAYARMFGYASAEEAALEIDNVAERIYVEPERRKMLIDLALGTDGFVKAENRYRKKDGSLLWGQLYFRVIRDCDGEPKHLEGFVEDITESKESQEALLESEERYRAVFNNSAVGISVSDRNGKIINVNPALLKTLGYTQQELLSAQFADITHPDDVEISRNKFGALVRGEIESYRIEKRYISKDGEIVWVDLSVAAILDENGVCVATFGMTVDITERKRSEEALREANEVFQTFADQLPANVFIKDHNSRDLYINKYVREVYDSGDWIGRDASEYFPPEVAKAVLADEKKVFLDGPILKEEWIPDKKGVKRLWETRKFPIPREGKPPLLGGVSIEITDRKNAEEALRTSEAQLSNAVKMAHLGHWEYDVAKDLFTFNDHFYQLFRTTVEQVGGYTMSSAEYARRFVHPDDRIVAGEEMRKSIETADPHLNQQLEHRIVYADGEVGYITVRIFIIKDELGHTVRTYGVNQDITDRKRAEEALRKSEERLELALQGGDLGLWDLHVPTGQSVTNQRSVQMLGYSLDEIEPNFRFWESLLHPDDRQRALEKLFKHLSGSTDYYENESRVRHKSGAWKWILSRGMVTERDPDGKPLRMTGTYLDITDKKLAESQAAEANELREKIFSESPMGIAVYSADGQCISANEALGRIVGADKERLLTQNFRNLASWKDSGMLADAEQVLSEGTNSQREIAITTTFGKNLWANIRMARITSCGEPHVLAVFNNITERRTAEDALKFEREQLLSLFESINEVILVIDPVTHEILFANTFTGNIYRKKLIGATCYETLNGLDSPCRHCQNEKILKLQGQPYQWEYSNPILNKDFLATDRIIRWPDGRDVKFQIAIDITERKKAQEEQDHLKAQLFQAQKMESIGTLAGGIAHDFNNLLTVVQGFSEMLLMEMDPKTPGHSDLLKIHEAGLRGAELVRNLLAFSRKAETKPRPINLNHEVVRIEKLLSRTIPKMIKIELHLEGDLPAVNADPDQMGQVLMNLAVNAEQAMPDGGALTIATANISPDEGYCRSYPELHPGDYVLLTVSDTGHGMERETLEHIFEPFFTTKGVGKGTGLGLAMVYGIVRQHEGHIICDSEPNRGSTFKIYLPAIEEDRTEKAADEEQALPRGGTETILLVDDEDLVRDLGAKFLTRVGYTVLTAASGPEAVRLYLKEGERISLVILDLIMPEMGGDKCLEEILAINPDAMIVISSGAAVEGHKKETLEFGARGFVSKPFRLRDMLKTVREVLDFA